jgi:hypothetical protein
MDRYRLKYYDPTDWGFGCSWWTTRAHSEEHAIEKFYDQDDGFQLVDPPEIEIVRE